MGSPGDRDRVDAWLNAEVEPLAPPPGTFGRIRRRARRRKAGRAMMSGAGIVIVIAAAVAAPRIASTIILQSHSGRPRPSVAISEPSPSLRPSATGTGKASPSASPGIRAPQPTSSLSAGGSGQPVPQNFQPTSVTFVSATIGAVIGQAGTPGHCATPHCTSLAGTSDYGTSWYGVSAPLTGAPDGSSGVSQLRFLTARDGWAFGPALWVTHDGGADWHPLPTGGKRVTALETAGARAFAIFASCTGTGANYEAGCTAFSLYSSPADTDQWQPVPSPAASLGGAATAAGPSASASPGGSATAAGPSASASLVLAGGQPGVGYLLAPSGELLSGRLTGAPWKVANTGVPCRPGAPGANGQPTGALLAADANLLVLVCTSATNPASDTQAKQVVESTDGGARWFKAGVGLTTGIATSLATQAQDNLVVLATDAGIYLSANGGHAWRLTQPSPRGAAPAEAGFSYVGMTSPTNGVALPADASLHEVFITTDGGSTWLAHAVSGR
jgi:hypothetical protein